MPAPSRRSLAHAPAQTPPPPSPRRRRRVDHPSASHSHSPFDARDRIADEQAVEQAAERCETFSDNSVFSCFPTDNTQIPQHEIASFVWNSRLPQFTQTNLVNIYLFNATSQEIILSWRNVTNPRDRAGVIRSTVDDTWFGPRGAEWKGGNMSYLYYWVVTGPNDDVQRQGLPQPIFTAVQTTFADSVLASMSSTSAAAAASSSSVAASLSSLSASLSSASAHATPVASSGSAPTGSVQSSNSSSFPHWAIAVIVVLGVLALLASVILFFFILRRLRNRQTGITSSNRNSIGSSSPMMANVQTGHNPQSPLLGGAVLAGGAGGATASAAGSHRPNSPEMQDGASMTSRVSEGAPFSGADAAVMANAFRATLRQPHFADRPIEEGESPDELPSNAVGAGPSHVDIINRELAEEGRDIRSVSSSRGVKVETLSDRGDSDTIQDHPH
ncbi:hypothetical protein K474DRAFT_114745 [Panus rudis PR-1116 ss-1]|nr:hypothetical protein K474DRAFT_114745 [Panus rudis PR-1116 ss-1]